jgi:steroid 5-alpha reductase family enzyme
MNASAQIGSFFSISGPLPAETAILLAIALLVSAAGFYRFVYFISLGYAFSIATMATASLFLFRSTLGPLTALQCLVLAVYGVRLGTFLLHREWKTSYRRELSDERERAVGVALGRKLLIWVGVSLLYVAMFSPCLFNLDAQAAFGSAFTSIALPIGLVIMVAGLLLESLADRQKSAYKQRQPDRFCDTGLYAWVRCPNYLGEITFWIGVWISGLAAYAGLWQWLMALIGVVCIVLIMLGSTKRLERKQSERYGDQLEFQRYTQTVPILIPFVPVYTLQNVRVYLE